jgi:hypothetical protein
VAGTAKFGQIHARSSSNIVVYRSSSHKRQCSTTPTSSFIGEHAQCVEVERALTDAIPSWSRVTPLNMAIYGCLTPIMGDFDP